MSKRRGDNQGETTMPDDFGPAALIRAAADGELTDEQQAEFDRLSEAGEISRQVAFERDLRDAVGRVMGDVPVPTNLRARVAASVAAATAEPVRRTETRRPARRTPVLASLGGWAAIAAVLAIAATLVVIASRAGFTSPYSTEQAGQLVGYISTQHDECSAFGEVFDAKMEYQSPAEAHEAASEILETTPDAFSFEQPLAADGYEFAGLGRCGVPGGEHSVHLMYQHAGRPPVSLFIQTGVAPELDIPAACCLVSHAEQPELVVWQEGSVRYYLYSRDIEGVEQVLEAFGIQRRRHALAAR